MSFVVLFLGGAISRGFAERMYSYVMRVLRRFRAYFHQIYAKAVRYVVTGKVSLIFSEVRENFVLLLIIIGDYRHVVLVSFDKSRGFVSAYCSCPDFIFNVGRRSGRRFCAHIIAVFICLESFLSSIFGRSDSVYKCSLELRSTPSIVEVLSKCADRLLIGNPDG